jgi:mRNA interferase YafQ
MLKIDNTTQFKRDLKKYKNQLSIIKELDTVIKHLAKREPLEERFKDHPLIGNWKNCRECHVKNDVLLIYRIKDKVLLLERFGSHSELFH